jgi:hypothetical protein
MDRQSPFARSQYAYRSRCRSALVAAGWIAGGTLVFGLPALARQHAAPPAPCGAEINRSLFEVEALKSELMVVATNCQDQEQYNAFVQRYQPELAKTEHELDGYFRVHYGRNAQHRHDEYVTSLANADSDMARTIGADFCPRNGALFSEVMALRGSADLPSFAAGQDVVPADLGACQAAPQPVEHVRLRHVRTRRRHAK